MEPECTLRPFSVIWNSILIISPNNYKLWFLEKYRLQQLIYELKSTWMEQVNFSKYTQFMIYCTYDQYFMPNTFFADIQLEMSKVTHLHVHF